MNIYLKMLFLTFNYIIINFGELKLFFKNYTLINAINTTKQVKVLRKKEFTAIFLNLKEKTYIFYVTRFVCYKLRISFRKLESKLLRLLISTQLFHQSKKTL